MSDEPYRSQKLLVVYSDGDGPLAKRIVSEVSAKTEGLVCSSRVDRYGCNPKSYTAVIALNDADIDKSEKTVFYIKTLSFSEMKEENGKSTLSYGEYLREVGIDTSKTVVQKLQNILK